MHACVCLSVHPSVSTPAPSQRLAQASLMLAQASQRLAQASQRLAEVCQRLVKASQRLVLVSQRLVVGARNWVRERSEECGANERATQYSTRRFNSHFTPCGMDGRTDRPSYRYARTHLKRKKNIPNKKQQREQKGFLYLIALLFPHRSLYLKEKICARN